MTELPWNVMKSSDTKTFNGIEISDFTFFKKLAPLDYRIFTGNESLLSDPTLRDHFVRLRLQPANKKVTFYPMNLNEYLLGSDRSEFERLEFQHNVWRENTNAFFDRIGVGKGWHCLDVGAGPGFVSLDLRERVDLTGSVTALEPSALFLDHLAQIVQKKNWKNMHLIRSTVEETVLPQERYDLIFARWVIAFVAHPENFFLKLLAALKPGGIIAFQDYYYEGLSLYPRGGPFDHMADAVRAYYKTVGGDPYITGKLREWFRRHGLTLIDYTPHSYAGGPDSPIFEWAHRFFSTHIQKMVEKKATSQMQGDAMLADWNAHRSNPDALFFSPVVVDVAGRKE